VQKKTRQESPRGSADKVQTLLLAGTIAARTHAPLARHLFYVFLRIDCVDALALYVGDIKSHGESRADERTNVKFFRSGN
jgi:hypothetical protein